MKPGATASPVASISRAPDALAASAGSISAAILRSLSATSARKRGAPLPSTTTALRTTTSYSMPAIIRESQHPAQTRARFSHLDQAGGVAAGAGAAGEYSIDLRVGKLHVRAEHGCDRFAEVGRHSEVALLVQARRRESGPAAVDFAAFHWTAHHPHHVAVSVIGAAVAVLMHRAAEFRDHEDDGVLVVRAERLGETREALGQRLQMSCELAGRRAFADVRIPAAERHERDANGRVAADQTREPVGVIGETLRRWRAGIGLGHVLRQFANEAHAGLASVAIGAAYRIVADVHLVEGGFDDRP